MKSWQRLAQQFRQTMSDENFLRFLSSVETLVSKLLSIAMVVVILITVGDLGVFLMRELVSRPIGRFNTTLLTVFGLFLNVLIALEILENITAYLKKHVIQVELVIVTSLIAVSRKIIILDLEKTSGIDLIALAVTIFALSFSYWIIRYVNRRSPNP
ncbi:MAG: phosphate-starvation-inducible PsiE family protein [Kovacikia sp.]